MTPTLQQWCWEFTQQHLVRITGTHTSRSSTWWWRCAGNAGWSPRWCPGRSRAPRGRRRAAGASYSDELMKRTAGEMSPTVISFEIIKSIIDLSVYSPLLLPPSLTGSRSQAVWLQLPLSPLQLLGFLLQLLLLPQELSRGSIHRSLYTVRHEVNDALGLHVRPQRDRLCLCHK